MKDYLSERSFVHCSILIYSALLTVLLVAQSVGQTIEPGSGKEMCSALTPSDFTKVGVQVSRLSSANLDDDRSAYCIYDSKAGKVEFDIFYPAGDTPADAQNAERAAQGAIGGKFEPVKVPGSDDAVTNTGSPQGGDSAAIIVRKGTTMFNIGIPHSAQARQQLVTLSETVVSRLKK
ncbi:MAG TPA: hypothetical protein VGS78_12825 [Candidatus Sulfotelmatobacter sp.]|nr:hypothetical protein [Candidatus Sulfotelmatobacter sp.]